MIPSTKQLGNKDGSQNRNISAMLPINMLFLVVSVDNANADFDFDFANADVDADVDVNDFPFERQAKVGMRYDRR